ALRAKLIAQSAERPPDHVGRRRDGAEVDDQRILQLIVGQRRSGGHCPAPFAIRAAGFGRRRLFESAARRIDLPRASWLFTVLTEMQRTRASSWYDNPST